MPGIMDILAQLLNPQGGGTNRLAAVNDRMGDAGNYLSQPFAPQQMPQMAPQQAMPPVQQDVGAFPPAPPPQGAAPMAAPQQAPQAMPAPSGGGLGGILSGLLGGQSGGENQTAAWLQKQGMDAGTAIMFAKNKPALQQYLLQRSQGQKPLEVNGRLVDPNTYQVLADFSDKSSQGRRTTTIDGKLVDTDTGQVIGDYGGADETGNIKEYEYAVKNGQFSGSFTDWQTKGIREQSKDFSQLQDVRKEIQGLPSYKNYSQAAPIYDTMIDASSRDTKAADLNLVYGLGKIFDPGSVVREGEMVMVKDTASLPDWFIGTISSVNGGARLQPETRAAIIQEARSRIGSYKTMLDSDMTQYNDLASQYNLDPKLMIPPLPKIRDLPKGASKGEGSLPLPPPVVAPPAPMPQPQVQPQTQQPATPGGVTDWKDWLAPKRGK